MNQNRIVLFQLRLKSREVGLGEQNLFSKGSEAEKTLPDDKRVGIQLVAPTPNCLLRDEANAMCSGESALTLIGASRFWRNDTRWGKVLICRYAFGQSVQHGSCKLDALVGISFHQRLTRFAWSTTAYDNPIVDRDGKVVAERGFISVNVTDPVPLFDEAGNERRRAVNRATRINIRELLSPSRQLALAAAC